jgi:hypothetical protein
MRKKKEKKPDKSLVYRTTMDFDVAEMFAKSNCKHCYGRGYIETETGDISGTIRKGHPNAKSSSYCRCVHKNAKKYDS